jgi:hypothetical protein
LYLWLNGYDWTDIGERVGKSPKAATRDFWRWLNKALEDLGLQ